MRKNSVTVAGSYCCLIYVYFRFDVFCVLFFACAQKMTVSQSNLAHGTNPEKVIVTNFCENKNRFAQTKR